MIPASLIARQIGAVLRDRRVELGMTQPELARRVGTHRPLVARFEKGIHVPSLDTLFAYAEALDLEPEEVIRRARWRAEVVTSGKIVVDCKQ